MARLWANRVGERALNSTTRSLGKDIVIVNGARTPFGTFGGTLKDMSATDLGVHASKAAIARSGIDAKQIDQVIFGNAQQTGTDAIYLARHVGLKSGTSIEAPAITLNRLCGSGFQAIVSAAEQILLDEAEIVLAGGTESMSQAPHTLRGARWGIAFGQAGSAFGDSLWDALYDPYAGAPMAITAENLAAKYEISRLDCDTYAARTQAAYGAAAEAGFFKTEIAPIELPGKKGTVTFDKDEHARPGTTLETLAKLRPVFKKDGVVTAGNASGICDGAAAVIVTTMDKARALGLTPIARLVNWGIAGCEPTLMGIGPVPASRKALARAGMGMGEMSLVEVNEAFAPQYLAVEKALELDRDRTNVNGGAIALGHPLAASGARITLSLICSLRSRGLKFGLGSACIGGGQGISVIVEAL